MGVRKSIRKAKAVKYAKGAKGRNKPKSVRRIREVNHPLWDNKDTLINNYTNWGILTDPNVEPSRKKKVVEDQPKTEFLEELEERVKNEVIKPQRIHMAVEDKFAVERLITKHGRDNIDDMAEDKKLNIYFWNPTQIKKMIAQYEKVTQHN